MATNGEMLGFPQPSRPPFHDTNLDSIAAENRFTGQYLDGYDNNDDDEDLLRGFVEELDEKRHEMFDKLVSKVKKDVPIKKILRETVQEFETKPVSDVFENFHRKMNSGAVINDQTVTERGLDSDFLPQDKLERFRVKTVNVTGVGVVKEESS